MAERDEMCKMIFFFEQGKVVPRGTTIVSPARRRVVLFVCGFIPRSFIPPLRLAAQEFILAQTTALLFW